MITVWLVLLVYMSIIVGVSLYAKRYVQTTTDFLLASRKLGLVLVTATLAATHYGGGFILGEASWATKYGLGGIWYGLACGIGLVLLGVILAHPMRALTIFTVPEVLEIRFNSKALKILAALLSLTALVGILGAQVWACSAVFEALGINGTLGAALATILFIAYTSFSGLWAVVLTDLVQIILGAIGILLATIIGWVKIGGLEGLRAAINKIDTLPQPAEAYFSLSSPGITLILLTLMATTMYTLIGQDFYQRLFAAKNKVIARSGAILSGVGLILLSIVPVLAGMLALGLSDNPAEILANPKTAIPSLLLLVLGSGIGALFMAAILAAIMSTADSLLTAATSHIVKDFYHSDLNPEATEAELLRVSRITSVIVGVLALIAAMEVRGIINLMLYSYDIYTAGVFIPLILGLYWKRATKEGALAGMLGGSAVVVIAITTSFEFAYKEYLYISGALVSLALVVGVSLATKQETYPEKLKEAFRG